MLQNHFSPWFLILGVLICAEAGARQVAYRGIAFDEAGKRVYEEEHRVEFDASGSPLRARTLYKDLEANPIAVLESDFKNSLTAPDYVFKDFVRDSEHGVRWQNQQLVLFSKAASKDEVSTILKQAFDSSTLLVGGQGLHYYLAKHLDQLKPNEITKVALLIPASLDVYQFRMKIEGQSTHEKHLHLDIDNFFLRIFAPSLKLSYAKESKNLNKYFGLSNILTPEGELQSVTIDYEY